MGFSPRVGDVGRFCKTLPAKIPLSGDPAERREIWSLAMAAIIDGKAVAADVRAQVALDAAALEARTGHRAGLVTILVGEDPASEVYVRNKIAACREAGMESFHEPMPATSSQREVLEMVDRMNADDGVDGILVQAPLPAGLNFKEVLERIDPTKDVDGFHPLNVGRLVANQPGMVACTPKGVMELLDRTGVEIEMITGDMVKPGATVIDVGVNRTDDGLRGDVHFPSASEVAGAITPVPGGVGPMTIAMLLRNTVDAATARLSA